MLAFGKKNAAMRVKPASFVVGAPAGQEAGRPPRVRTRSRSPLASACSGQRPSEPGHSQALFGEISRHDSY